MNCFSFKRKSDYDLQRTKSYTRNVYPKINKENFDIMLKYQATEFERQWNMPVTSITGGDPHTIKVIFFSLYEKHMEKKYIPKTCDYGIVLNKLTDEQFLSCRKTLREALRIIGLKEKYIDDIMTRQQRCKDFMVKKT